MVDATKVSPNIANYTAKHKLIFEENSCKGCDLCAFVCPKNILRLDKERINAKGYNPMICFDIDDCIACGMCAKICPDSVITVIRDANQID